MRRHFTKQDIYEATRDIKGSWQERWYHYMGSCTVLTIGEEIVNFICLGLEPLLPVSSLPLYLKKGERFVRVDEELFYEFFGEGAFVGKAYLPVNVKFEFGEGITGTVYVKVERVVETGYTKRKQLTEWRSEKRKGWITFEWREVSLYGYRWEALFEEVEKAKEKKRRKELIKLGRDWCRSRGIEGEDERYQEIYLHVGESIMEEQRELQELELRERERLIWGGDSEEESFYDFSYVFHVGPSKLPIRIKAHPFLNALFHGDPRLLWSCIVI